jgi:hypothetical protein
MTMTPAMRDWFKQTFVDNPQKCKHCGETYDVTFTGNLLATHERHKDDCSLMTGYDDGE